MGSKPTQADNSHQSSKMPIQPIDTAILDPVTKIHDGLIMITAP
jgi:hypothetical protein